MTDRDTRLGYRLGYSWSEHGDFELEIGRFSAEGGIRICRRMSSPGIGSEINPGTFVRLRLHVFAPSWFQNWFQRHSTRGPQCGMNSQNGDELTKQLSGSARAALGSATGARQKDRAERHRSFGCAGEVLPKRANAAESTHEANVLFWRALG